MKQAGALQVVEAEALPSETSGDAKSAPKPEKGPSPKVEDAAQSGGGEEPSGEVGVGPEKKPEQEAQASTKAATPTQPEEKPNIKATAEKPVKENETAAKPQASKKSLAEEEGPVEHDEKPIKSHTSYQSMIGSDSLGPDSVPQQ